MNEQIKVVLVEPGKFARIEQIDKGLESYQAVVGGWIEQTCPYDDPVAIICNEEGKVDGLPLNRALADEDDNIYDILAGTFFICGLGEEDCCSLTDELADKYLKLFMKPESFAFSITHDANGEALIKLVHHYIHDEEFEV